MPQSQPKVSLGLPVYNGERYLAAALTKLLAQDFEDFELIVSDNASTDRTEEICRSFAARDPRVRYFRNSKNIGLAANHNRTFELAKGCYFKWVAHDDDFPASMLGRLVSALDAASPAVCAVYSRCEYIADDGSVQGFDSDDVALDSRWPHKRLRCMLRNVHMFNSIYGLIRSEVLRKTRLHGLFPGSDYVLLAELAMLGKFLELPEALLRIRRHPGRSFTANRSPKDLRELFAPGKKQLSSRLSVTTYMEFQLLPSAMLVPHTLLDKTLCLAMALYMTLRTYAGRRKRTLLRKISSVRPPLRAGDLVEILGKDDILKTLDENGQLDGMPFMPEMFAFCGTILRVSKRAHKTCDTVYEYKGRRMKDAVHLEGVRCDGQAHGGCEASCSVFWKTAWLKPLDLAELDDAPAGAAGKVRTAETVPCSEATVVAGTRRTVSGTLKPHYVCQATQVPAATEPLPWWSIGQYVEDYASGNVGPGRIAKGFAYSVYRRFLVNLGIGTGPLMMWLYDKVQALRGGSPYPSRAGKRPAGTKTPTATLHLRGGEWVRVKSYDAIRETCDQNNLNRGMTFDKEMVPYCGGTYQVLKRVSKIIDEKTGGMLELKNPCIILDSVVCQARYSQCRLFCPRNVYPYWREAWLERVDCGAPASMESAKDSREGGVVGEMIKVSSSLSGAHATVNARSQTAGDRPIAEDAGNGSSS